MHHINRVMVACKRGHPFVDVNTIVRKDGSRACRTCMRAAVNRHYRAKKKRIMLDLR